jgi:hypothetical protein
VGTGWREIDRGREYEVQVQILSLSFDPISVQIVEL